MKYKLEHVYIDIKKKYLDMPLGLGGRSNRKTWYPLWILGEPTRLYYW